MSKRQTPPRWRRRAFVGVLLLALAIGSTCGATVFLVQQRRPITEGKRRVWVEQQQPIADFAAELQRRQLVRHRWLVRLAALVQRLEGRVQPAGYRFPPDASAWDIVARLRRGGTDFFKVTVREGLMSRQVAERLQEAGYPRADELATMIGSPLPQSSRPNWLPHGDVEGYLLPDTYFIDTDAEPSAVVTQMLTVFENQFVRKFDDELKASPRGLHELVILASLVEREVVKPDERALVAGVYLNRLRGRQRLECDATVQYALGYWKKRILYSDLRIDSPYNTYRRHGLPPGPICNPGLGSLEAALKPRRSDFLFYVADGSGGHAFSRTYDEHRATIRRIRGR